MRENKMSAVFFVMVVLFCCAVVTLYRSKSLQGQAPTSEPGDILQACREVSEEFLNKNAVYATYSYNKLVWHDIRKTNNRNVICDPTYVALVLYKCKLLTEEQINAFNYNWCGEGGIPDMLQAAGWKKVRPEEIRPGDIVVKYTVCCCIYEEPNLYWDYTDCIREEKSAVSPHPTCISLDECLIFRAPERNP